MINKPKTLALFLLLLNLFKIQAQDTTNTIGHVSIASPTAASLGKYGDIPVSYHTGVPQISIPIYTVESGSLKLPVSLNYHASGLKVQEQASWVGANWSLNAGGMITRTVIGAPDDKGNAAGIVTHGHYTDYGYNSYLTNSGGFIEDAEFARGARDGEPDLYFFNFGGYSGKFYFNDDRTPIFLPQQDFKVQAFVQSGQGFTGFIVTASDGVKYYFGGAGNNGPVSPVESTITATPKDGYLTANAAASSWFLNKIISADGMDSITLSYASESYSYYTISMSPVFYTYYNNPDPNLRSVGLTLVKNFTTGVRLSQISFPNGTVTFTRAASPRTDLAGGLSVDNSLFDVANTSAYALGSITITDNNGFCKKDSLYYGYFFDNSALSSFFSPYTGYNLHSDQNRLRLDSIQEVSCDGSLKVPPHKFTYFSEPVPRKLSFGIDHWGFANGVTGNSTLVPTYKINVSGTLVTTNGANRDAAWPAMRGGSLQKITYPTGGYTLLDFDPHDFFTSNTNSGDVQLCNDLVVRMFGQSTYSDSNTITVQGNGNSVKVTVINSAAAGLATFTILNSSNTVVYSTAADYNQTINGSVSLSAGTYKVKLDLNHLATTGGATAHVTQLQSWITSQNTTVGGLRIKTITNNDGLTANDVITSYSYRDANNQSTSILYSRPVYIQTIRNDLMALIWSSVSCSQNGCAGCDGSSILPYYISPTSVQPMATSQGAHIGYSEVVATQTGNGKTVYDFYGTSPWGVSNNDVCVRILDPSNVCSTTIPSMPAPPLPYDFKRGEPKSTLIFNESGKLLKETDYFSQYANDRLITPGHITINVPGIYSYSEYNLQTAKKIVDSTVTYSYDAATTTYVRTVARNYYGSPYHTQATRKVVNMSTGDSLATNIKYAFDFRVSSCDAIPDSLTYYLNAIHNDSTWMFSNIASCTPKTQGADNCRWAIFTQFRDSLAVHRIKFIAYRRRSYADPTNLLNTCYINAAGPADTLLKPILRLFNAYVNPAIEVTEWKNTNLRSANFTRYDTSTSPIGFTYPGRTKLISLQTPSSTFTGSSVSGNTIAKDSRYIDETFYNFVSGNPQQITPHSGVTSSYIWDYLNTRPVAKVDNAASDQIAYTSFEANGTGNWTIGSTLRDTGSVTGRKSYKLSNGNISKSGLTAAQFYTISYWTKNGSAYTIAGTVSGYPVTGKTIGGWTYYEHVITGQTSVTISGSTNIDELRLYPANAEMSTYTYDPLVGMTSACDLNNRVTYYEYDKLGRLNVVRDQDRNIIKTTEYKYKGQALP